MSLQNASVTAAMVVNEQLTIFGKPQNIQPFTGINQLFNNLGSSSTPPAKKDAAVTVTMTGSAVSVDLTNITNDFGGTFNGNTQKAQFALFVAPASNAAAVTIAAGASNAYNLLGASFSFKLAPGQFALVGLNNASPTIGSGAKNIDCTGTASDTLQIGIISG
jgi:hypothetical protein